MCGAIPPLSKYAFMAWYLLKQEISSWCGASISMGTALPLPLPSDKWYDNI
jgi:hypothetical protein